MFEFPDGNFRIQEIKYWGKDSPTRTHLNISTSVHVKGAEEFLKVQYESIDYENDPSANGFDGEFNLNIKNILMQGFSYLFSQLEKALTEDASKTTGWDGQKNGVNFIEYGIEAIGTLPGVILCFDDFLVRVNHAPLNKVV